MKIQVTVSGLEYATEDGLQASNAEVVVNQDGKEIIRDTFSGKISGCYIRTYEVNDGEGDLKVSYTSDSPHFDCRAMVVEAE